jgi:hypothetical protein
MNLCLRCQRRRSIEIGDIYFSAMSRPPERHRPLMGEGDKQEPPEFGASFMVLIVIALGLAMIVLAGLNVILDQKGGARSQATLQRLPRRLRPH